MTASLRIGKTLGFPKTKFSNGKQSLEGNWKDHLGMESVCPVRNESRMKMRAYIGGKRTGNGGGHLTQGRINRRTNYGEGGCVRDIPDGL